MQVNLASFVQLSGPQVCYPWSLGSLTRGDAGSPAEPNGLASPSRQQEDTHTAKQAGSLSLSV